MSMPNVAELSDTPEANAKARRAVASHERGEAAQRSERCHSNEVMDGASAGNHS